jgi:hypothetical protein
MVAELAFRVPWENAHAMAPLFFDAHVCSPPPTEDLVGREMDFECRCGRRWRLEHWFAKDGLLVGPSWILL